MEAYIPQPLIMAFTILHVFFSSSFFYLFIIEVLIEPFLEDIINTRLLFQCTTLWRRIFPSHSSWRSRSFTWSWPPTSCTSSSLRCSLSPSSRISLTQGCCFSAQRYGGVYSPATHHGVHDTSRVFLLLVLLSLHH